MKNKKLTVFFTLLGAACVLLTASLVILFFILSGSSDTELEAKASSESAVSSQPPQAPTEASSAKPTQAPSVTEQPTEESAGEQTSGDANDSLNAVLNSAGYTLQDLSDRGCKQLMTVSLSEENEVCFDYYYLTNDTWKLDAAMSRNGSVGSGGVVPAAQVNADNMAVPLGLYPIGEAFYQGNMPKTSLDLFEITEETYWVDDPKSAYYNQKVDGDLGAWDHAVKMWEDPSFCYGFVIENNPQGDPDKGDAVFFHLTDVNKSAYIGADEKTVLAYLKKLDAKLNPYILIAG